MKIHVDEKNQEVRIEWGGKNEHYATVAPDHFDRHHLRSLRASTGDSEVVYETLGYRVDDLEVLSPAGGRVATATSTAQAHKIADALNAAKED